MKTEYYKVTIDGGFCIFSSLKDALSSIEYDIQGFLEAGAGEPIEVKFEIILLTDEEFEALPEFEGY